MTTTSQPGFFTPTPERPQDDVLRDYLAFLEARNGSTRVEGDYPNRERWLEGADASGLRHRGKLDAATFEQSYAGYRAGTVDDKAMLTLLTFMKANAGEAYGVEVVGRMRHKREASTTFEKVERVLGKEETYHTRILLGAAHQFDLEPPKSAWRPPASLKVLITTLAYSPKALFHPVLLASEVAGVFTFNWMLEKVREVFRDQPGLKEALEERLMEILVDELGHIAFNRMAVGPTGMSAAKSMAPHVAAAAGRMHKEFSALGWDRQTLSGFDRFDYTSLPEEARRRAFYV